MFINLSITVSYETVRAIDQYSQHNVTYIITLHITTSILVGK